MTADEFASLRKSIVEYGQKDDIVLFDGQILDGRHRYQVCLELGLEPRTRVFEGTLQQAELFVIACSLHRNLTPTQRAVVAESFWDDQIDVHAVSDRFGVNNRYVSEVRTIRRKSRELYDQMRDGRINVSQAVVRLKHQTRQKEVRKVRRTASIDFSPQQLCLLTGDCIQEMKQIDAKSVDLIFTDPPYNIGFEYHADPTGDRLSDGEYEALIGGVCSQAHRLLKPGGSFYLMMPIARLALALNNVESLFELRDVIAWTETFGQHREGGWSACWRPILYAVKPGAAHTWNGSDVRIPSAREAKYNDPRAVPGGKTPPNVWDFARVTGTSDERVPFAGMPPQLPEALIERAVLASSNPGDVVLDPFNGNGTTGIAALRHGRRYIGIDRSAACIGHARTWIASRLATSKEVHHAA